MTSRWSERLTDNSIATFAKTILQLLVHLEKETIHLLQNKRNRGMQNQLIRITVTAKPALTSNPTER